MTHCPEVIRAYSESKAAPGLLQRSPEKTDGIRMFPCAYGRVSCWV